MSFNPQEWTWIQHLAVWPLATLILLVGAGFILMTATDKTVPDDIAVPGESPDRP